MCNLTKGGAIGVNIFVGNLRSLMSPATGGDFHDMPATKEPMPVQGRMLTENVAMNIDVDFFKARVSRALEAEIGNS